MPIRYKNFLIALMLCVLGFDAEAAKGPVLVNVDVPPGVWKAIRLKNLPKGALVALEVKCDGEITALLLDSDDYQRLPNPRRPLFMGLVNNKLSFSVTIPESDHYYVVLDNRSGKHQRAVTVTAGAARGKTDQISAANKILRRFERQLHQIFIFNPFPVGVESCDHPKAFGDRAGIVICAGYMQQLYNGLGDRKKAKDALGFSIFHELGRILLIQWDHPSLAKKTVADEFATVLMIMLKQTQQLSAHAQHIVLHPSITEKLIKTTGDDRHPLTVQRAEKILAWLKNPRFALGWQKFLTPHMQTILLKKLQRHPTEWTDLPLVEKELTRRAKMKTQKNLRRNPYRAEAVSPYVRHGRDLS